MNIVILSINILVILLVAFFFYKSMNFFPEESLAMAIMSILVLIYITGIAGDVRIALGIVYVVACVGGVQFLFNRKLIWKKDRTVTSRRGFFSPAVVFFVLAFAYAVVAFSGILLHNWDELAQWGKAANYMIDTNRLAYGETFDGAEVLISSTTFFHYFIAKPASTVLGKIDESQYYVSNLLLWFSAVLLPLSGSTWKEVKRSAIYVAVIFVSMTFLFIQPYYNIYCDQACALWAGGFIAWQMFGKKSRWSSLLALMILWNVSLFRSMVGPMFAAVAILAIGIYNFVCGGSSLKERFDSVKKKYKIKDYIYGFITVVMPFLATIIWSVFVGQNALIRSGATVNHEDRFRLTLQSAIQKVFVSVSSKEAFAKVSYFTFFLFACVICVILCRYFLKGRIQEACKWIYGLYLAGFVVYWVVLVYAYMTVFGYADSISTGSIERYFSDYMMLGVIPLLFPLFMEERKSVMQQNRNAEKIGRFMPIVLIIFTCILVNDGFAGRLTTWYLHKESVYHTREKIVDYANSLKRITDNQGKIYMINQDTDGFAVVVADYEMGTQLKRSGMPYYFQDTDEPVDIAGLLETDIENFPEILESEGYEYLWVYKKDEFFEDYIKSNYYLDEIKNGDVYRIDKVREGKFKLTLLENIMNDEEF